MTRTAWIDLVLPGAALVVAGRLAWGLPLLALAVGCWALALLAAGLALALGGGFLLARVLPWAGVLHLAAALAALALRRRWAARPAADREQLHALARAACRAWLRGEPDAAARARALTAAAPNDPRAWRLAALLTGDRRAAARAQALERWQEGG